MAAIRKDNPKGVDYVIDLLQEYSYNAFTVAASPDPWTNYESYHRAYVNEKKDRDTPEVYIGNGEYKEVFNDDSFNVTSFWLVANERPLIDDSELYQADISIIFQVDKLDVMFPTINHRADEELHRQIHQVLKDNQWGFVISDFVTGIDDVYAGLSTDQVKWDDISHKHVVRFNFTVEFQFECGSIAPFSCAQQDAVVQNSDLTYNVNVSGGTTLELPDITHTQSDGSPSILPAQTALICTPSTIPSGIRYNPVPWTGVEDIHAFNDDGWNKANGFKDYIGPSNPIYTARIDPTAPLQDTLINDNFYGNKSLWTNNIGYYFEKGTTSLNYVNGNLRDADGTVISASTIAAAKVIFGDYWVNNYNRLGYYTVDGGVLGADWLDLVTVISTGTYAGFSDYRLTDFEELKSIWLQQSNSWLYAIALYKNLATVVTTSTTRVIDSGYAWAMERDGDIVPYLKNQNRGYLVRNHFN